jgi:4-hydroxy-tetrahydrodipicolinate reductase
MKIALFGYGRMGSAVEQAAARRGHEIAIRVDGPTVGTRADLAACDVGIDFSVPGAVPRNVGRAAEAGLPLVVGTTGWYDQLDEVTRIIDEAGTSLVWAPNFSIGVQLFFHLAREAARLVDTLEEFDVHVHETHHRYKVDHPSGTAGQAAEILVEGIGRKARWVGGLPEGEPEHDTVYVTSARVGEVAGTHEIGVDGPDDRIELTHIARSRHGFARGAVFAAEWLPGKRGVFTFEDWVQERLTGQSRG